MATTTTTAPAAQSTDDKDQLDPIFDLYIAIVNNQSKLNPQEYVSEELSRRFVCVSGQILSTFLQNDLDFAILSKSTPSLSQFIDSTPQTYHDAITTMIAKNYFKRVVPLAVNKKRYGANVTIKLNFAPKDLQHYDDDGLYAFIIQPQAQYALVKSLGIVGGVIAIACFKIWPVILRIILWWLLLFTTVFLLTSIAVHLLSKILFTLMCLRGYSFMPNLMDEEIGFFETFSPILGTGGEHQRRWALEREIQVRARQKLGLGKKDVAKKEDEGIAATTLGDDDGEKKTDNGTKTTKPASSKSTEPSTASTTTKDDGKLVIPPVNVFHTWQAGLFAFIIFFILGGIGAYNMGFFDPEMVPDFLVNNNEMRYYFPAIAATSSDDDGVGGDDYAKTEYLERGEEISM